MTTTEGLAIYEYFSCPFCARVRSAMDKLGIRIELRDVRSDAQYRDELIEATGRTMVPCLRIEGDDGEVQWMHESADIVRYLQSRFG
jgi:glutathione S-transferase